MYLHAGIFLQWLYNVYELLPQAGPIDSVLLGWGGGGGVMHDRSDYNIEYWLYYDYIPVQCLPFSTVYLIW